VIHYLLVLYPKFPYFLCFDYILGKNIKMDKLNNKTTTAESKNDDDNKKLITENAFLKSKIAYSIGSLETICYLLKNEDSEILNRNLDHLRSTVNRVLEDLKKDF
jgi:hypothetical protein